MMEEDINWNHVDIKSEIQFDEINDDEDFSAGCSQENDCETPSTEISEKSCHALEGQGSDFSSQNNIRSTSRANTNDDVPNLVQQIKVEHIEDEYNPTDQGVPWHTPTTEVAVSFQEGVYIKSEYESIEDTCHDEGWLIPEPEVPSMAVETNPACSNDAHGFKWHVPAVKMLDSIPVEYTTSSAAEIKIESEDVANQGPLHKEGQCVPLLSPAFPVKIATVTRGDGKVKGDLIICPRHNNSEDIAQKDLKENLVSPSEKPSDSVSNDTQFEFIDCTATIKQEVIDTGFIRDDSSNYHTTTINQEMLDMGSNGDDHSNLLSATTKQKVNDDPNDKRSLRSRRFKPTTSERCYSSEKEEVSVYQRPPKVEPKKKRVVQPKISRPTEKRNSCPLCPKSYLHIKNLQAHVLVHTKISEEYSCSVAKSTPRLTKWYCCMNCRKRFRYKQEFIRHVLLPCKGETSSCELCPAKFSDPEDLCKHLEAHFREKPTSCVTCSTLLKGISCKACATRYRWQATFKPFYCKQCDYKIRIQLQVRSRLITKFEDIKFSCGQCFTKYKWPVLAKEPCEDTS